MIAGEDHNGLIVESWCATETCRIIILDSHDETATTFVRVGSTGTVFSLITERLVQSLQLVIGFPLRFEWKGTRRTPEKSRLVLWPDLIFAQTTFINFIMVLQRRDLQQDPYIHTSFSLLPEQQKMDVLLPIMQRFL